MAERIRLDELIDSIVHREPTRVRWLPPASGPDEFICASCHLVMPRGCLADEWGPLCRDCVADGVKPRPGHHRTVERVCPACGRTLMIPDREDAACGFFCPGCGIHLRRRGGHIHLEWDHAYHPELGPHHTARDPRTRP